MGEVGLRTVLDGSRVMRFRAAVIGAGTSQRGSIPRWSELVVYQLEDKTYLISKIGRSIVAHHPTCLRVNHRMLSWVKAQGTGEEHIARVRCSDCWPELHPIAPETMLETTRYRAIVVSTVDQAVQILTGDRGVLFMPQLIRDVLAQCAVSDSDFARYSEALGAPNAPREKSTRTP
jgi:hypothetical protein